VKKVLTGGTGSGNQMRHVNILQHNYWDVTTEKKEVYNGILNASQL